MRLLLIGVALLVTTMAISACSESQSRSIEADSVRTKSFELIDDDEEVRASINIVDGSPSFVLNDRSGTGRVEVKLDAAGNPVVTLFDDGGARRAGLEFANGENPALFLRDDDGTLKAGMQVQSGGAPHLFMRNSALEDGFAVTLVDRDQPVMALADPAGRNRAFFGLEELNFDGSLVFVAADGSIQHSVP